MVTLKTESGPTDGRIPHTSPAFGKKTEKVFLREALWRGVPERSETERRLLTFFGCQDPYDEECQSTRDDERGGYCGGLFSEESLDSPKELLDYRGRRDAVDGDEASASRPRRDVVGA